MNSLFLEFRDPLFSVIIFFTLIFIITFFSYWWGKFKSKEDSKHLDKFLRQFHALPSQDELKTLIGKGDVSEKSWLLLANAYYKNGDYEKSIDIYSELVRVGEYHNRRDTMFLLGKTYFRAGFLGRSKEVFLEILKNNPRTPQALKYLLLVYEYMREYTSAIDVLEPLDELRNDIQKDSVYLKLLSLLHNAKLSDDEKSASMLEIYHAHKLLTHMVFEYLFRVNPQLAWQNLELEKVEEISDILWSLDKEVLDFDIIAKDKYLQELFSARGDVELAESSSVFEFDVLINVDSKVNATLAFEYICDDCKQVYPFGFNRCGSCHSIDTATIEFELIKDYHKDFSEENNSFQ